MKVRAYMDNVIVAVDPLPTMSEGGALHLPQQSWLGARGSRTGVVIESGPGFYMQKPAGARGTMDAVFVKNETKPGDRVVFDAQAGTRWEGELSAPRHNMAVSYTEDGREIRIMREQEIPAILEE